LVDKLKRKNHEEKLRMNEKKHFMKMKNQLSGTHGKLVIGRRIEERNTDLDIVIMRKKTLKRGMIR